MCTKYHINRFISGTSKRVKFVENVLRSQKCNHILCGNISLLVHVYSKCYKHILQIFFSCTLPHRLSTHLLIHAFWSDTRNSRGSALSYTGPVIWNSLPFSVGHAWTVECQTTVKSPPVFHIFPAVFRSQFISVCVWTNVMWKRFFTVI